ncbi:DUF881 domain-containing protein [Desulforamulus hydrothermalis]|uniref:Division initiation protein n=1 Tax=Desulforamulus hydrothermalis Lam5 = DSM 18033 TaxID=1121428 RepID=K8E023_9FIRM|nr:DUF881 domain-containing protein [Desulforamulus hydrothermalis]CCO08730.1 conserved hypothetical protein [Desulforamulus hydrothermalis Lam5 = DSM 18033]SHG70173.1 Uncharacterized conserved protein YlxW, UPF0749 family [Desulforamulus hydrothermalis Lam5 = DSM 18033]
MKMEKYQWGIVLVGIVLGLMLSVQYRSYKDINETPPIARVQALSNEINQKKEERNRLQQRVNELREKLDKKASVSDINRRELEIYRIIAGTKAVVGPGVEVTLNDSNVALPPGQDPNLFVLHDEDVLRVINELKAAGAEAIALNGVRLIATSEIRCIGPTILTNKNKRLPAPFTITAIGNPDTLENSLFMKGGVVEQLKIWGIQVQVRKKTGIEIAEYTGPTTFEYARPAVEE